MANNIIGNRANVAIAKVSASFADMGLNSQNIAIVYLVDNALLSWRPDRQINPILGISEGQGYYIIPKVDLDLTTYFAPPLPTGGGSGNAPIVDAGTSQSELPSNTQTIPLSGSATPNGSPISSYLWVYISFPEGRTRPTFVDRNSPTTEMGNLFPGTYVMQLQAEDEAGNIGVDTVVFTINQPDSIAVSAGPNQLLDEGTTKTNLYGTATPSGNAVIISYQWSVVSPGASGVTFTAPTQPVTAVNGLPPSVATTVRLTVTDNLGYTYSSDVVLTVQTPSEMYYTKNGVENRWNPADITQLGWVYLPQGYSPTGPARDAYLFMGGIGSNLDQTTGDNIMKFLDPEVGLPKLLYDKTIVLNSVVFMAQRRTGFWDLTDAQKALTFMKTNFNINAVHIYDTGYSSGGKGAFDLPNGNPGDFAAAIPCAPVATVTDPNILKNIPLMIAAGYGDSGFAPTFAANGAAAQIDAINNASPKGKFPPLALFPWDKGHNPGLWTTHVYNINVAGWDFDKWAKKHSKNDLETMTNYVIEAENKGLFIEWAQALIFVTRNLPDSPSKNALLARLNVVKNAHRANGERLWMINFGSAHTFNMYSVTTLSNVAGTQVNNVVETDGTASTLAVQNSTATDVTLFTDGMDNYYQGVGPEMYKNGFRIDATSLPQVKIKNLLPNKLYDLQLYYGTRSKDYYADDTNVNRKRTGFVSRANGDTCQSWQDGYNTTLTINHMNIRADVNGEIVLDCRPQFNHYGAVLCMLVREKPETLGWLFEAKWNFAKTIPNNLTDWNTVTANPAIQVVKSTDSVSGVTLSVGGINTDYWQVVGGGWAGDTEANNGAFPPIIPSVVGQSAFFTQGSFNAGTGTGVASKPNLILDIENMGLRKGDYEVIMYSNTKNVTVPNVIDSTYVSADFGLTEKRRFITPIQNNYTNLVNFKGTVREGGQIIMNIGRGQYGYTYINALLLRALRSKQI